jgi:hypothetical protein
MMTSPTDVGTATPKPIQKRGESIPLWPMAHAVEATSRPKGSTGDSVTSQPRT